MDINIKYFKININEISTFMTEKFYLSINEIHFIQLQFFFRL